MENRDPNALYCDDPSLTKQYFKDDCDINKIVKRFKQVNHMDIEEAQQGRFPGRYGDVSNIPDYQTALAQVRQAHASFEALPKKIRAYFDNDAEIFIAAMNTKACSRQTLEELGMVKRSVVDSKPPETGKV